MDIAPPELVVKYEVVIGLEVHVQLAYTHQDLLWLPHKLWRVSEPRMSVRCVWGFPARSPVLSREAVELAMKGAMALNCAIRPTSRFSRKNYFYPDLPKGYQISQYDEPLAEHGWVGHCG